MNLQVLQDQDDLMRRIGNKRLQKLDQALPIEGDIQGPFLLAAIGRIHCA